MHQNMKTILYMAMSLDWYISDRYNKTPWSEEEWGNYKNAVSNVDGLVVWYQTYRDMFDFWEFEKINNPRTFIFTSKSKKNRWKFVFVKDYTDFLQQAELYKIDKILVGWWKKLNSYFLENNIVDEIFLDVEPFIFWGWLKLFDNITDNKSIELVGSKEYWDNSIQLHYTISKLDSLNKGIS